MIPDDRRYTKGHLWVRLVDDLLEIGATQAIVKKLTPLLSVDLPDADDEMKIELPFGELEGTEEVFQLFPPVESRIAEVNDEIVWNLQKLQDDPYGEGWLVKMDPVTDNDLETMLTAKVYRTFCAKDIGAKYLR
jgi:glycine cleavage system H protein